MNAVAFLLGFITIGLVKADVSHLRNNQHQQQPIAGHYIAHNGQVVKQSFNQHGDATFSSRTYNNAGNNQYSNNPNPYWWMNTETMPFTRVQNKQNYFSAAGCNGCASRTLNVKHNTQHDIPQTAFNQNQFTNVKHYSSSFSSPNALQSASVSGSPQEVNNFFSQQAFDSGRIQQSTSCSDSNFACVAPKFCQNGFIDQSVEQKAARSLSGRCFAPEVCCRIAQRRNAPYNQDNAVSAAESTSEILTKEGYVVRKPSNQYLPSYPEFKPSPTNNQQSVVRPNPPPRPPPRPVTYAPRPTQLPRTQPPRIIPSSPRPVTQRPYVPQPQPTNIRPVQYDEAPIVIPVGCAAALNCTSIQYCTAAGVISKTPVSLTPEQEMFRVPLTDCREPSTQQVGKCCRDPDYVDPWPVGRTGQYVPEELNNVFDSGAYKPEQTFNVPVRVKAQDGYVVPQPSNNQQRLYLPPSSNRI